MDAISVVRSGRKSSEHDPLRHRGKPVEDELKGFIRVYKDGSVERFSDVVSEVPASEEPQHLVASKDVVMDSQTGLWARFYLPRKRVSRSVSMRLPLVIYFHGGGFVLGSPAWSIYHVFICRLASETNCLVMSVAYRLAPEHRLPVAYDDCFSAVQWIRRHAQQQSHDSWLSSYADFSRCFIAGDSAGGNIAHHVALRCGPAEVRPLQVRGVILLQPFFGGEKVETGESDPNLSRRWMDVFWKLALPVGAKRDGHPACNPLSQPVARFDLPAVLVCVAERDVLKQRNMEYCEALKSGGKNVRCVVFKGVGHAFQVLNPDSYQISELIKVVHDFVNEIPSYNGFPPVVLSDNR